MPPHLLEFLLLFVTAPAVFAYTPHRIPAIPALWVWAAWCLYVLLHDPAFDRTHLWRSSGFARYAPSIFAIFGASALLGVVLVRRFVPELFLSLPRTSPKLWAALMLLYPVLSVYPQGVVFRAFIFARYQDLFPSNSAMVLASAAAFAWVHIIFHNRLALILTGLGGVLFGLRYLQTGSLFITSVEHSLYGCAIFTVGVGRSLHHASMRR